MTPRTVTHQAPLSMEFSRQEYWSGLPFPPPGHLPDPGIERSFPVSQADSLSSEPPGRQVIFKSKETVLCGNGRVAAVFREDSESGIEDKELQKKFKRADQKDALSGKHWLVYMCVLGS